MKTSTRAAFLFSALCSAYFFVWVYRGTLGPSIFGTIGRDGISSLAAVIAVLFALFVCIVAFVAAFVVTKIVITLIKFLTGRVIDEENSRSGKSYPLILVMTWVGIIAVTVLIFILEIPQKDANRCNRKFDEVFRSHVDYKTRLCYLTKNRLPIGDQYYEFTVGEVYKGNLHVVGNKSNRQYWLVDGIVKMEIEGNIWLSFYDEGVVATIKSNETSYMHYNGKEYGSGHQFVSERAIVGSELVFAAKSEGQNLEYVIYKGEKIAEGQSVEKIVNINGKPAVRIKESKQIGEDKYTHWYWVYNGKEYGKDARDVPEFLMHNNKILYAVSDSVDKERQGWVVYDNQQYGEKYTNVGYLQIIDGNIVFRGSKKTIKTINGTIYPVVLVVNTIEYPMDGDESVEQAYKRVTNTK